jgi:hypothetical protein
MVWPVAHPAMWCVPSQMRPIVDWNIEVPIEPWGRTWKEGKSRCSALLGNTLLHNNLSSSRSLRERTGQVNCLNTYLAQILPNSEAAPSPQSAACIWRQRSVSSGVVAWCGFSRVDVWSSGPHCPCAECWICSVRGVCVIFRSLIVGYAGTTKVQLRTKPYCLGLNSE